MKKLNANKVVTSVFAMLLAVMTVVSCSSKEAKVEEAAMTPSTTVAQNSATSNLGAASSGRAR